MKIIVGKKEGTPKRRVGRPKERTVSTFLIKEEEVKFQQPSRSPLNPSVEGRREWEINKERKREWRMKQKGEENRHHIASQLLGVGTL